MIVVVAGTGTEVGKTWVTATVAAPAARARRDGARAQAGAVVRTRRRGPTDADVLAAATGEDRRGRLPAAPLVPVPDGATDGRRARSTARRSRSPTSRPSSPRARRAHRARRGRGRRAFAARRPTATPSTSPRRARPSSCVLVADAGLGTINLVRLSVAALAAHPRRRRVPQPLRRRRRTAPPQPRLARARARASRSSPTSRPWQRDCSRSRRLRLAVDQVLGGVIVRGLASSAGRCVRRSA